MMVNPYLSFPGTCEEAFKFYETVLDGKITFSMTYGQSPTETPEDWKGKIMHATLTIGDSVLMGSDATPQHYTKTAGTWVSISLNDVEKADAIFTALADGGQVTMAIQQTFWAKRFGMTTDRFGIPWMINCE
jgi:PhnB protein